MYIYNRKCIFTYTVEKLHCARYVEEAKKKSIFYNFLQKTAFNINSMEVRINNRKAAI